MFSDPTDSNIFDSLDFGTQKARDDDEANFSHISPSLVDTDEKMRLWDTFKSSSAFEVQSGTLETSPSPKLFKEDIKKQSNVENKSTTFLLATPPTTPPPNNCSSQNVEPSQNEIQFQSEDSNYLSPDESSQDSISTNSSSSAAESKSEQETRKAIAIRHKIAKRAASNHRSDEKPKRQKVQDQTPSVNDCDHLSEFCYAMIEKHKSRPNPYIFWRKKDKWIFAIDSNHKEDIAKLWAEHKRKINELKKKSKIAFMQKTSTRRRKVVAKHSQSVNDTKKDKKMMEAYKYKSLKRAFLWLEINQDFEKVTDEDGVGKKLVYKFGKRFRDDEQRKQKAIEDLSNYNY